MADDPSGRADSAATEATALADRARRDGAVVVERSDRLRMRIGGPKAAETLNGIVTNDVTALVPGTGQYALALTPKGKIIADPRLFALADGLLVDVSPNAAPGWSAMIRKYVNPRLARYVDVSQTMGCIACAGPGALAAVREAAGTGSTVPDDLPPYGHVTIMYDGDALTVARVPDIGVDGYDLFASPAAITTLRDRLTAAGATPATGESLTIARVEAGRPEWGIDMDESTLAQEADMERLGAISFTKGCYTGQETVARVHFRGHVNRLLRGLRITAGPLPATGAEFATEEGKVVAVATTVTRSPRLGGIALALVRREVEPGTTLTSGDSTATVLELPFPVDPA